MARIPLNVASRSLDPGSPVRYSGESPVGQVLEGFGNTIERSAAYMGRQSDLAAERAQRQREEVEEFEAQQGFNQMKLTVDGELPGIIQNTPASGLGFHDASLKAFDAKKDEFLQKVPERLKPRISALLDTERLGFSNRVAQAELDTRNGWYRGNLAKANETAYGQVYNNPEAYEAAKSEALRAVDSSGLPDAEKQEWRDKVQQGIAKGFADRLLAQDPAALMRSAGIAVPQTAATRLVDAVTRVESTGDPNAVSPKGAAGLMQVMPETGGEIARELNDASFPVNGSVQQKQAYLSRPDVSRRYGSHYLNKMLQRYGGDVDAALVAYNGGPERADNWLRSGRDDNVIPKESADYYKKVRAAAGVTDSPVRQSHLMVASAFLGAQEGRDGGALSEFIRKSAGINIDPRQTAWCAAYVNAVLGAQGIQGNGSLSARSFLTFGEEVANPSAGDIVVLRRGADPTKGHVGFFAGYGPNGQVRILGGNQGNAVTVANFDQREILAFRRPPSVPNAAAANAELAKLPGGGPSGGMVVTDLDPRLAALPFSERLKLGAQAQRAMEAQQQAIATQQKAAYSALNDSINLGIVTGGISSEEEIFSAGLDDGDTAARIQQFRSQQGQNSATASAVRDYISGGLGNLNPLDSDQAKTANAVYDTLMKETQDDTQRAAVTSDFIRRTTIIPDPIQAEIRRGAYGENPQDFANAMDRAGQIKATAPIAFDNMPNGAKVRDMVTSFQHYVNDVGLSATEAAQKLIARNKPEWQTNEKVFGPGAEKALKDVEISDVEDAFSRGWFQSPGGGADATTQSQLLAEYRDAFRDRFIETGGNEEEAKALAKSDLAKTWGVSNVSGSSQLMKYPPEKLYPAREGGHDYLRMDMETTAKEIAGGDVSNVWLRPFAATAADVRAKRPPRYRLFYEREVDGQKIVDEVPGAWAITPDQIAAGERSGMDAARAQRDLVSDGLDRNNSMGLRDFVSQEPDEVVAEPVPTTSAPAQAGRVGRYNRTAQPQPADAPSDFVDPATLARGIGGLQDTSQALLDPNSREGIANRLQERGQELRRNAPR